MSEPTGPVCPECNAPRAADGTPACSCARRASDAHRETRTAEAAVAEDFSPLRIRPFVEVGATAEDPDAADAPDAADGPDEPTGSAEAAGATAGPADVPLTATAAEEGPPPRLPDAPTPQLPPDGAPGPRRRRRATLVMGAGAAGAVLLTGGLVGGLFFYTGPSRDGSGTDGVRAALPDASTGGTPSSGYASPTVSFAPSSAAPASSPAGTPTDSATADPTGSASPARTPADAAVTTAPVPAPSESDGGAPVLRLGDRGAEVTELQLRLRQVGFYHGDADGDFDSEVESAVRGYQFTRVVLEDEPGVYGAATRAALESETSEP
ncbi:peptidoglycan-binding protein [Streptomyces sp. NPDC020490]|uniref:peptidoglycan-binding protein n=1 Tax=Streptomyces sp. NPDC020490 TaxID=3365078 RepID=UPI0037AE61D6